MESHGGCISYHKFIQKTHNSRTLLLELVGSQSGWVGWGGVGKVHLIGKRFHLTWEREEVAAPEPFVTSQGGDGQNGTKGQTFCDWKQ